MKYNVNDLVEIVEPWRNENEISICKIIQIDGEEYILQVLCDEHGNLRKSKSPEIRTEQGMNPFNIENTIKEIQEELIRFENIAKEHK